MMTMIKHRFMKFRNEDDQGYALLSYSTGCICGWEGKAEEFEAHLHEAKN